MVTIKTKQEIKTIAEGGYRLNQVMNILLSSLEPGIRGDQLEKLTQSAILNFGGKPAFLNYSPGPGEPPFPAALCLSLNDVIVHGIPKSTVIIKEGDLVKLDIGMEFKGLYTDMARSIVVGTATPEQKKLIATAKEAFLAALKIAKDGNTLGDIGFAIESRIKANHFFIIKELTGHGVGYSQHEDPWVLNYGIPGKGLKLKTGMVLALEPMPTLGTSEIIEKKDGSFATADGSLASHYENTIVVTPTGGKILTK
ncbi:MAG: type I methionyl aminopeptidase [Candidatus Parcubacteria bacterium]|nr:type I methionyl aminopeptidase [Candidatus Parcubacteria bacterium]